ncbi:MAG: Gfo/Idh/MocA family oxidoreductase [Alphaproteobacteria bacterium]|nr:MAG: Gfo/Idh/MocA family oxidoreductase [Alphaproteobacteria bacterium]
MVTRIAVIGAGLIGRKHLGILKDDPAFEVAGIADPSPETAAYARANNFAHFADTEALLDQTKPDGVIVANPNALHRVTALAAIARGIPAIVEKPLADTISDALAIVEAAANTRVPVLTGHHRRHNPIMQAARDFVAGGALGTVVAASGAWLHRKPDDYFNVTWRREAGGGPILINAIHDIDCLRMVVGEIASVQATASGKTRGFAVEDTAAAVLTFANGALGTFIVSDATPSPWNWEATSRESAITPGELENCFIVAGTMGSLAIPQLQHWSYDKPDGAWTDPLTRRTLPVRHADPYPRQLRHFARVIRGEEKPVIDAAEGARTLAATLAIAESARTGRPVSVAALLRGDPPH